MKILARPTGKGMLILVIVCSYASVEFGVLGTR